MIERVLRAVVALTVAAGPLQAAGIGGHLDPAERVEISGSVHPLARPEFDRGPADPDLPMRRMVLVLSRPESAEWELARFLADQQDPASPMFHRWLTPEEFGRRFGASAGEVARIRAWLESQDFTIDEVARGRGWINFSGTAAQVERAFRTPIHRYVVAGIRRHANAADPSLPRGIAALARGILTMHSFPRRSDSRVHPLPEYTDPFGEHFLSPADFQTIYGVTGLIAQGTDGSGQSIAIVGRTNISIDDVRFFRSHFGLPVNDPEVILNGPDPGNLHGAEEQEADLDVEWSGVSASGATIRFVVSKSTDATDGVDLSAQYIVDNDVAPIMSESFGECESDLGPVENAFYGNLWAQAAAEGITALVSSGDSGASGCDEGTRITGSGLAVSGLASTPYNVCVGGTQFDEGADVGSYWNAQNADATSASARSYIPESAWNESGTVAGGGNLWSTGGGASGVYRKPAWQAAPGVPLDGARDLPDVSLSASQHDGYLFVHLHGNISDGIFSIAGTSASTPALAGILALVVERHGRLGNANPAFYSLARAQYSGAGPVVFHDVTQGDNSVPGVSGYSCGPGYDLATGLGSVNASALVANWPAAAPQGCPEGDCRSRVTPVAPDPLAPVGGR